MKATIETRTETVMKPVEVTTKEVVLRMTPEEAKKLQKISGYEVTVSLAVEKAFERYRYSTADIRRDTEEILRKLHVALPDLEEDQ